MAARRPNLRNAGLELGIAGAAFVSGLEGSLMLAGLIAAVAALYWGFTRRETLSAMPRQQLLRTTAISLAVLLAVVAACYGLGLLFRGMTG
ncbi:hypothetical protein [Terricaulis sp.]|uniref:hypothetical protein n=1 Tax=Terricaulis sp. TaxID=2768686 RepID=UPI0037838599